MDLPDGTEVTIFWSGGNGPHNYRIIHRHDMICTQGVPEHNIDFVGPERFHTRVILAQFRSPI